MSPRGNNHTSAEEISRKFQLITKKELGEANKGKRMLFLDQPSDVHSHLLYLHVTQHLIKAEYANPKSLQDTLRPLSEFARLLPHKLAKVEGPRVCSTAGLAPESTAPLAILAALLCTFPH